MSPVIAREERLKYLKRFPWRYFKRHLWLGFQTCLRCEITRFEFLRFGKKCKVR